MFQIRVAPKIRLIQSTLADFLTVAEVRDYAAHMEAAHGRWFRFSPYRLVIDAGQARIQSQDVLAAFAEHIAGFPQAERIGVVCGLSLSRFQILRLLDRPYLKTCDGIGEAQDFALNGAAVSEADFVAAATPIAA